MILIENSVFIGSRNQKRINKCVINRKMNSFIRQVIDIFFKILKKLKEIRKGYSKK